MAIRRTWKIFVLGCFVTSIFWIYIIKTFYTIENIPQPVYTEYDKALTNNKNEKKFDSFDYIGLIKNEKDLQVHVDGFRNYAFNNLISERIGFERDIPFTADERCIDKLSLYPKTSKKASILICFHNEAWSTLLRTVYSIIQRTPSQMIEEIILLDDSSNHDRLIRKLPSFLKSNLPIVKYYRSEERLGLIRARMKAARHASGDILVFLDSHCEVNKYWLEPLVARIVEDQKTVVCPVIDMISSSTFVYQSSSLVRGGFNWGMHFTWEQLPEDSLKDKSQPYSTPSMAGGLFAMDRNYFFHLGGYDEGMEIWGGENLEMSFRIWMCGGRLEIIPCSRVGHVFRSHRPYSDKDDSTTMNALRVAEVWLDDYKKHFYNLRPELKSKHVDVESRKALRTQLKCKTFEWYLDKIYPEVEIPNVRSGVPYNKPILKTWKTVRSGQEKGTSQDVDVKNQIMNKRSTKCLGTTGNSFKKKTLIEILNCHKTLGQEWLLNENGELKISEKLCMEVSVFDLSTSQKIRAMKCHGDKEGQEWQYDGSTEQFYNPATGMCLSYTNHLATLKICDQNNIDQKWIFQSETRRHER